MSVKGQIHFRNQQASTKLILYPQYLRRPQSSYQGSRSWRRESWELHIKNKSGFLVFI